MALRLLMLNHKYLHIKLSLCTNTIFHTKIMTSGLVHSYLSAYIFMSYNAYSWQNYASIHTCVNTSAANTCIQFSIISNHTDLFNYRLWFQYFCSYLHFFLNCQPIFSGWEKTNWHITIANLKKKKNKIKSSFFFL